METKKLREYESFVTQDTDMFHDSIAANIAIGKPDASRAEIIAAAKKVSLHDAQLFLLDEPTSNLDSLHEGVILKALLLLDSKHCQKTNLNENKLGIDKYVIIVYI